MGFLGSWVAGRDEKGGGSKGQRSKPSYFSPDILWAFSGIYVGEFTKVTTPKPILTVFGASMAFGVSPDSPGKKESEGEVT